jgi:hypothetical protein
MSWSTHSTNNINICKNFDTVRHLAHTYMRSATPMISRHINMRCNNMTASTQEPLTTLHDKCQHATSKHLTTACYKKLYDEVNARMAEIIYTLWQVLCITRRDNFFFFTWFGRPTLDMRRIAFLDIVQNFLPQDEPT